MFNTDLGALLNQADLVAALAAVTPLVHYRKDASCSVITGRHTWASGHDEHSLLQIRLLLRINLLRIVWEVALRLQSTAAPTAAHVSAAFRMAKGVGCEEVCAAIKLLLGRVSWLANAPVSAKISPHRLQSKLLGQCLSPPTTQVAFLLDLVVLCVTSGIGNSLRSIAGADMLGFLRRLHEQSVDALMNQPGLGSTPSCCAHGACSFSTTLPASEVVGTSIASACFPTTVSVVVDPSPVVRCLFLSPPPTSQPEPPTTANTNTHTSPPLYAEHFWTLKFPLCLRN